MVDTIASVQTLNEFVQNLLDDLLSGRITPDAAIIASSQYPRLRRVIGDHNDEIARMIQDEEGLRIVLEGVLRAEALAINRELPQFQVEKPDSRLSPEDVVARARALRVARLEVVAAMGAQRAQVERTRKTFIGRLVQNWIAQTSSFIDKEDQKRLAGGLQTELDQKLSGDLSADEATGRVRRALTNARVGEAAAATIQQEAAPSQQELAVAKQRLAGIDSIPKELVVRLDSPRPDRFATIAIQTISTTTLSPSAALARAASLARVAEALSGSLLKEKDIAAAGVFFQAFASGPMQKAFAAAADAILNQLSPAARQEVVKAAFSRALEGLLTKTDVLVGRLGQDFVESELFRVAVGGARKEFAGRQAGTGGGVKQARGVLEDVVGSIFGGPIMGPLVGTPRETVLSYLELLSVEAGLPREKSLLFPDRPAAAGPPLLSADQPGGLAAASLAALVQRLPSWQVFYLMLLSSGAPTVYASLGPGGNLVASPSVSLGLGGGLGGALGWAGRGLSGAIFGVGGGLVGMIFGGGLGALFNRIRGPRQPDGLFDDMPKLIAIGVVVVIVLLFVFPSFLNTKLTSGAARLAALFVNTQTNSPDQVEDSGGVFPPPDYIDLAELASREFACLSYGGGVQTREGRSGRLTGNQEAAIERAVVNYPQIKLLACGLSCATRKISVSSFAQNGADKTWGWAPSSAPGNIIFYPRAFASSNKQLFAHTLAHEIAHNIDWFGHPLAENFHRLGCETPESYHFSPNSAEAFAQGVADYLFGAPGARTHCGGRSFAYFSQAFSSCLK